MSDHRLRLPDRFELGSQCGSGRFATVYVADDKTLQRKVALKISSLANRSKSECKRIRRELRVSCKLRHPNIVSAFDGFEEDGHVFLVLPYLDGGDMESAEANKSGGLKGVIQLAQAVDYLHRSGVIHGDIKPANVVLDQSGNPHLADFGSCLPVKASNKQPETEVVGSPAYLAPELISGRERPTIASDIYSLGATLFFSLTGSAPYQGDTISILTAVSEGSFPTLKSAGASVDDSLEAILQMACHSDPSHRYTSAAAFADDIKKYVSDRPIIAKKASPWSNAVLWTKRNRGTAILASVLALVVLLGTLTSVTGLALSLSRKRSIVRSQDLLIRQAEIAKQNERDLRESLAEIETSYDEIQVATEEENKLLLETQRVSLLVDDQRDAKLTKQAEADGLTAQSQSLKLNYAASQTFVGQLNAAAQRRKSHAEMLPIRNSILTQQPRYFDPSADLSVAEREVVESLRGLLSERLPPPRSQLMRYARVPQSIVFDRQSTRALLLSDRAVSSQMLIYDEDDNTLDKATIRIAGRDDASRNWSPRAAGFSSDSTLVAIACEVKEGQSVLSIRSADPTEGFREDYFFGGKAHAVQCINEKLSFVVRSLQGDVQIIRLPGSEVVFSASQHRAENDSRLSLRESSVSRHLRGAIDDNEESQNARASRPDVAKPDATAKLLPFFISIGTDPSTHLLFASSASPRDSDETSVFLHSVDFRQVQSVLDTPNVTTFDCGKQKLADWPHQWQLSEHMFLGVGRRSLTVQSPPPLSNSRFAGEIPDLKNYRATIQVCENRWHELPSAARYRRRNLFVEGGMWYYDRLLNASHYGDSNSIGLFGPSRKPTPPYRTPTLDSGTGLVVLWHERGYEVIDLLNSRPVLSKCLRDAMAGNREVAGVGSDQLHRRVAFRERSLSWSSLAKWNPSLYSDIDKIELRLEELARRMTMPSNTESLLAEAIKDVNASGVADVSKGVSTKQQLRPPSNTGVETHVTRAIKDLNNPSEGYALKITSAKQRVISPNIPGFGDDTPVTLEAFVRVTPHHEAQWCSIAIFRGCGLLLNKNSKLSVWDTILSGSKNVIYTENYVRDRWVHIAVGSNGKNRLALFIDGKLQNTIEGQFKKNDGQLYSRLRINQSVSGGSFHGLIDSVRLSNSERYTSDFIPVLPMTADADTKLLYQFDEGSGNQILDSSGNGFHTTLSDPVWVKVGPGSSTP